jgi:hypothetical protein
MDRRALPDVRIALDSVRVASDNREEAAMSGKMAFVALAVTTALGACLGNGPNG